MAEAKDLYESPVVQCPSLAELTRLSEDLNLQCSEEELQTVKDHFKSVAASLQRMSKLQQPQLPVKYPRTSGYKPARGDNPYNGWYWRCDIKGADTGKLKGKTIGIKDHIPVAGVPMLNGTRILEGYTPEFDATVVTRVLDAGGHIIGKTNCEHMCFSGSSFTCDDGPVTNPHDETRTSGGSSSGSGVLVASGKVDMAIGGDQGGSIRIPSSWCGIVGLKPTYGLVPYTGVVQMELTMDHLGPMTKTVSDCALLLEVLAGYDEGRDPRQLPSVVVPEYSKAVREGIRDRIITCIPIHEEFIDKLDSGISGKKIGVLKEGFDVCTERDVADIVKREVERLREAGAVVEEVSLPEHLDGNGYAWKGFYPVSLQEAAYRGRQTRPQDMSGIVKTVCLVSEYLDQKYQNKFYAMGQNLTMMLTKAYDQVLQKYDALVMPTLPLKATKLPEVGASLKEHLEVRLNMIKNTAAFNSTGHPALSINAGFSEGLPVGMMVVGRHYDETTVLQVARAYEKIRDGK